MLATAEVTGGGLEIQVFEWPFLRLLLSDTSSPIIAIGGVKLLGEHLSLGETSLTATTETPSVEENLKLPDYTIAIKTSILTGK